MNVPARAPQRSLAPAGGEGGSLADVLERVLDKGVVIVGDIAVSVLDVELLSLKLRLFIASAQTAREMGLDWWARDPHFAGPSAAPALQPGLDPAAPAAAIDPAVASFLPGLGS